MSYIGVDYGSKRIGIAVSNEDGVLAFPHTVLANDQKVIAAISTLINQRSVKEIVIGESNNFAGDPNDIQREIEKFVEELKVANPDITISFEPEFMTSIQAERMTGKNENNDASAASIILQSFLDRKMIT